MMEIAACINLKDRTVGYYNHRIDPVSMVIRKLKSNSDINAIIEAKSMVFCNSIFPSDYINSSCCLIVIVPDDYKYSQRLALYDFCKTQNDISFFRVISMTRALALSVENAHDKNIICIDYNNKILSCCGLEIGDGVYEVFETFFVQFEKAGPDNIANKIKQSMKDACIYNSTPRHNHSSWQHYAEAYFTPDNPFMQDIRDFLKSIGVRKMRTISNEDILNNTLLWWVRISTKKESKLLLDQIPYEINTAHEISIKKDTTIPTSITKEFTTVKDKQEFADIPLVIEYLGLNRNELIGVYSIKINSSNKTENDIIQIETFCDADGIISVNALMKNDKKTYRYHLTGPMQGSGRDGNR